MVSVSFGLELRGFGFALRERTIVRGIDLSIPEHGVVWLLGPAGSGKSSLLRMLAGEMQGAPVHTWGKAYYAGAPLGERGYPALVGQQARLVMGTVFHTVVDGLAERSQLLLEAQRRTVTDLLAELGLDELATRLDQPVVHLSAAQRRALSIVRAYASRTAVVFIDEPTAALGANDVEFLRSVIARVAAQRAAVVVTHRRDDLLALQGSAVLLAGGVVQEAGPVDELLTRPKTMAGQQFADTGGCAVPSPDAIAEELDETTVRVLERPPPGYLRWVLPGVLAGLSRPGLVRDLGHDLNTLETAGISVLMGLEEQETVSREELRQHGIVLEHYPIPDMQAPGLEETVALCRRIDTHLSAGKRIGVHCRGGLGRTGTVLAAYFIYRGASAAEALSRVRLVEPRFVQTKVQLDLLRALGNRMIGPAQSAATAARGREQSGSLV